VIVLAFSTNGKLLVKSACYFTQQNKYLDIPQRSVVVDRGRWKDESSLRVPPRVKLFAWRCCTSGLPTTRHLAKKIPNFAMCFSVCGVAEETYVHVLFQCPLVISICQSTLFCNIIEIHKVLSGRFFCCPGELRI